MNSLHSVRCNGVTNWGTIKTLHSFDRARGTLRAKNNCINVGLRLSVTIANPNPLVFFVQHDLAGLVETTMNRTQAVVDQIAVGV